MSRVEVVFEEIILYLSRSNQIKSDMRGEKKEILGKSRMFSSWLGYLGLTQWVNESHRILKLFCIKSLGVGNGYFEINNHYWDIKFEGGQIKLIHIKNILVSMGVCNGRLWVLITLEKKNYVNKIDKFLIPNKFFVWLKKWSVNFPFLNSY
jgi:hypothetical protein